MRASRSTWSSPSSRASTDGFTVLELLVALGVSLVIVGATLTIALSSRGLFETDRHRTAINQNLRAGMDLLGIDVRQAGERLPFDAPAVTIENGVDGAPDVLRLRRNMLDYVLPVCKAVASGSAADSVFVSRPHAGPGVPQGCAPVPDENGDGWPDNLEAWRNYRLAHGGEVKAFIFNPVTQQGEFFFYDDEDASTFHLHKLNDENWEYDYHPVQEPRVYLLEEKIYRLQGDVLQSVIDEDDANALNLVSQIRDFQVRALFRDGTSYPTIPAGYLWTDLRSLEVTLVGGSSFQSRDMERTVTSQFFPRNVLSN